MSIPPTLTSERLRYRRLAPENLDLFHALAIDPHIRKYMMDGLVFERSWADEVLIDSDALFAERRVGLWLVYSGNASGDVGAIDDDEDESKPTPIGFAGFMVYEQPSREPQILYAFSEVHTGLGYATEVSEALIQKVESLGWPRVVTAVDAPNLASIRVLRKLDFCQMFSFPGAFGRQFYFVKNLTQDLPTRPNLRTLLGEAEANSSEEILETLVSRDGVRIERIVSTGQHTPDETWYQQDEHEWVVLLQGAARIEYADGAVVPLGTGDHVLLPAGCKHKVQWTDPDATTIWLAVFFR